MSVEIQSHVMLIFHLVDVSDLAILGDLSDLSNFSSLSNLLQTRGGVCILGQSPKSTG